jgi:hypothetical protein
MIGHSALASAQAGRRPSLPPVSSSGEEIRRQPGCKSALLVASGDPTAHTGRSSLFGARGGGYSIVSPEDTHRAFVCHVRGADLKPSY